MILFGAFDFNDNGVVHEQIQPLALYGMTLIKDGDFLLLLEGDSSNFQFAAKRLFVDGFQEASSQLPVDFNGRANNGIREGV